MAHIKQVEMGHIIVYKNGAPAGIRTRNNPAPNRDLYQLGYGGTEGD